MKNKLLIYFICIFAVDLVANLHSQEVSSQPKDQIEFIKKRIPAVAQTTIGSISDDDKAAVVKYYSALLDGVNQTNFSKRFAEKYLATVHLELERAVYESRGYKNGVFTNLTARNPKNDPRLEHLNAPLLSEVDEALLAKEIGEISELTHQTLKNLLLSKPKIRFISSKEFDAFFDGFYKASEATFSAQFYHKNPTNFAELFYRTNLHKLKCEIILQAFDYYTFDQKSVHLYGIANLFYNGLLRPVPLTEFEGMKRRIVFELQSAYKGDTFVFEFLSISRVVSDPIEQLFRPEMRPEIRPVIYSENEGEVFENFFYNSEGK